MRKTEVDVVVVGAGITGLVTAFNLIQSGKKVVLIDKADRTGGQMETITDQGFVFETGPNTGVLNNVEVIRLFDRLKGQIEAETAKKESKIRLIWKGKSFHALPDGFISAITTPLFSFTDKIRICFEPWRAKGTDSMESIASLTRRRLGKSFLDYAVDPFISGVYAGDPDRLVTRFAMRKLYNLEQNYGSFIRGAMKMPHPVKTSETIKVTKEVFSVAGGFGELSKSITDAISMEHIRLSVSSVSIEPSEGDYRWVTTLGYTDEEVFSNHVVTTVPGFALPAILPFADEKAIEAIAAMMYAPVVQVGVGVIGKEAVRVPQSFGGLVPSCEGKDMLGILFPSSCFENRAPEGGATLSFFLGGRKRPEIVDWSDEQIRQVVEEALVSMLGFPEDYKPDALHIFRHKQAIPQYEADSEMRIAAIEKLQGNHPGLILAGGIRDGIGLGDRIKQGAEIAEGISFK